MMVCTMYILLGLAFTSTIIEIVRYVFYKYLENLTKECYTIQETDGGELEKNAGVESSDSSSDEVG